MIKKHFYKNYILINVVVMINNKDILINLMTFNYH